MPPLSAAGLRLKSGAWALLCVEPPHCARDVTARSRDAGSCMRSARATRSSGVAALLALRMQHVPRELVMTSLGYLRRAPLAARVLSFALVAACNPLGSCEKIYDAQLNGSNAATADQIPPAAPDTTGAPTPPARAASEGTPSVSPPATEAYGSEAAPVPPAATSSANPGYSVIYRSYGSLPPPPAPAESAPAQVTSQAAPAAPSGDVASSPEGPPSNDDVVLFSGPGDTARPPPDRRAPKNGGSEYQAPPMPARNGLPLYRR